MGKVLDEKEGSGCPAIVSPDGPDGPDGPDDLDCPDSLDACCHGWRCCGGWDCEMLSSYGLRL